jgi:hypothetical protein
MEKRIGCRDVIRAAEAARVFQEERQVFDMGAGAQ